jgi:Tol biopolymer transport system component
MLQIHLIWAQGILTPFGQNRIQHTRFEWSFLRTENFDAFFYSGGKELANYSIRTAEENLQSIEKSIDHRLTARIEIICYNNLSDFKQSNFGLEELAQNTGGFTNVVSNKIYVFFDGDHAHLQAQIKEGLALVILNEVLYGGSIAERVQNATLMNLPEWYIRGLTSFLSKPWDSEMDNQLKDWILSKKKIRFNRLCQKDQVFAGHSMWKFLNEKNEADFISNLIYLTRLSRNYETALGYILNKSFKEIEKDWAIYYQDAYKKEELLRDLPQNGFKIKRTIAQYIEPNLSTSPKGNYTAFTTNKNGKYKVWLYNHKNGKTKKIFKGGLKYHQLNIDHSFPVLAWHAGGDKMAYVFEKKGSVWMHTIDLVNHKKEVIRFLKFDKITGMDFSENGRSIVLSAVRKGQSDLYLYDIPTRKERQLTFDFWDDKDPRFVFNSEGIAFSSNRLSDSLGVRNQIKLNAENNYDIFVYDIENMSPKLKRYTNTPFINETKPVTYNNQYIAYLSDYNGIQNRYASRLEEVYDYTQLLLYRKDSIVPETLSYKNSEDRPLYATIQYPKTDSIIVYKEEVYTYPLSNYHRNILDFDIAKQTGLLTEILQYKQKYYINSGTIEKDLVQASSTVESYPNLFRLKTGVVNQAFVTGKVIKNEQISSSEPFKADSLEQTTIDTNAYFFVNEFTPSNYKRTTYTNPYKVKLNYQQSLSLKINAPRFYDVTFFADNIVTQIDNSIINTYYQPIGSLAGQMFNQGLNGMFKFGLIDLFEDYRITGGIRVSFDLQGFDYFASFENLKKKVDQKWLFYRQTRSAGSAENLSFKNFTHEIRYILSIPFNQTQSIKFNVFYRQDREITKASNANTLEVPDLVNNWIGTKLEFIFDNTVPKGLNLFNGTRFKLFAEHYQHLDQQSLQLNTLGLDFRHYEKVHRQIIWASRLAANTSFGPGKVVYYLGGIENGIGTKFNNDIATAQDQNYIFRALACNLRGFDQNIRNGNTYALFNTELRIPVFQYAFNQVLRSEFLNHFQLVPFFDIGTAWVGSNPFSEDNTFNQKIKENPPLRIKVINVRDPLVAGFGGGLRTKLFGYFMRFDTAWGIQDAEVNSKPVYHLALGLDF